MPIKYVQPVREKAVSLFSWISGLDFSARKVFCKETFCRNKHFQSDPAEAPVLKNEIIWEGGYFPGLYREIQDPYNER